MRALILLLLLAVSTPALADDMAGTFGFGWGPVRENDSAINYKAIKLGYRVSEHVQLIAGAITGGSHYITPYQKYDYDTDWYGVNYLEVEQYLVGGIGIVKLTRQTRHLTSPYQFVLSFGAHYGPWTAAYQHLSNGHTGGQNYGEDMLIFSYGF